MNETCINEAVLITIILISVIAGCIIGLGLSSIFHIEKD